MKKLLFLHVLIAFGIALVASAIPVPFFTEGWQEVAAVIMAFVAVGIYFRTCSPQVREGVWGPPQGFFRHLLNFCLGVLSVIIVYPLIVIVGELVGMAVRNFFEVEGFEQVAITQLVKAEENRALLIAMVGTILFLVPILEELLFRGFLQGWLQQRCGKTPAILLTAIFFALFHYSADQGPRNIDIITSLFCMGLCLGILKNRRQSLWPPIGLHIAFNTINVALIVT